MYEPQSVMRPDAAAGATRPIERSIVASIRDAAAATGMDFGYLMAQAAQESSFEPAAKAPDSSASGLYQFTAGTWLQMMHDYGAKYGYGALASAIHGSASAGYHVADPALRRQILDLRDDPHAAAALGAEYARANGAYLSQALGRAPSATDLYMAHFLGPAGAAQFLKAAAMRPDTPAASLLPEAASANRGVFYDAHGNPLSVGQIYRRFQHSIGDKVAAYTAMAGMPPAAAAAAIPAAAGSLAGTGMNPSAGSATGGSSGGGSFHTMPRQMLAMSSATALSVYEALDGLVKPAPQSHNGTRHG